MGQPTLLTPAPYKRQGSLLAFLASGTECGSLDENCPPWPRVFEHLVPTGGTIWGGYGTFKRWSLAGEVTSLGVNSVYSSLSAPYLRLKT